MSSTDVIVRFNAVEKTYDGRVNVVERMNLEGLTLVPLKLYFKSGNAKVEVALARGRKLHDKRQALARKEADREADRAMGAVRRS